MKKSNHKTNIVIAKLAQILSGYYDVQKDVFLNGRKSELLAQSQQKLQHYAISKKLIVDESHLNDYLVIQSETSTPTQELLSNHFSWLEEWAKTKTSSEERHMRSRFALVLLLEEKWLPLNFEQMVKKYSKSYWLKFGINGWYETMMICYHLPTSSIYSNRRSKDFLSLLEKIAEFEKTELTKQEI